MAKPEDLKKSLSGRLAVFIDVANLEHSLRGIPLPEHQRGLDEPKGWFVDYEALKSFFSSVGDLVLVAFYAPDFGTEKQAKFHYFLAKVLKFKINSKSLKRYGDDTDDHHHRKANFDVELATDALLWIDQYDNFILFSGDCDFEYLIKQLRGRGKVAVVISRSVNVAKELIRVATLYYDLEDFRGEFLTIRSKTRRPPQ